ncbi:MAG: lysophospholipase [Clostridiales bacterium]|nr:lysophospholipase [Clostridiales bacterium]
MGDKWLFISEDDYKEKMEKVVEPTLRECKQSGFFKGKGGAKLHYELFLHPDSKGGIVISHGFCEYAKKFWEVVFYFYQAGYSVFIMEHRGHGYSDRFVLDASMVHVDSFDDYVVDFHLFVKQVVNTRETKDLILYGHSMGGAIAALYLEQYPNDFCAAILSSPMFEMNVGKLPLPIVFLWASYKKWRHAGEEYVPGHGAYQEREYQSRGTIGRSEARYQHIFKQRIEEKSYRSNGASYGWTLAGIKAVHKLQRKAKKIEVPVLLLQAGADTVVKNRGQNRFARRAKQVQLVVLRQSAHELYNSDYKTRRRYYNTIFNFLATQAKEHAH